MKKLHQMRLAINDAEFAIGNVVDLAKLFEHATNDTLTVRVSLKVIRQLANCYPALNAIVNDPSFTCKE